MSLDLIIGGAHLDILPVVSIINQFSYKRVVLQFSDEYLPYCCRVYDELTAKLTEDIDVYVTADSSFGSSVDDISAMHVDSDFLIYVGRDFSASAGIPVCILPPKHLLDHRLLCNSIRDSLVENHVDAGAPIILLFDALYMHKCSDITTELNGYAITCAHLPPSAQLHAWQPHAPPPADCESLNGLFVPGELINNPSTIVLYIGDNPSQLQNILLRMSSNTVLSCLPSGDVTVLRGETSKSYRERYVGVLRVKESSVIGLIVGSMGVAGDITRTILHRLHRLIEASGKKYYTFVMGRINEAKLCNFPEVNEICSQDFRMIFVVGGCILFNFE